MSCNYVVSHDTTLECVIITQRSGICMSCQHVAMLTCRVPLINVSLFRSTRVCKGFVSYCLSVGHFYQFHFLSVLGIRLLSIFVYSNLCFGITTIKTEFLAVLHNTMAWCLGVSMHVA